MSVRPVLIHVNGVTDELLDKEYFADIENFNELLGIHNALRSTFGGQNLADVSSVGEDIICS